jgi:hypothetical protein
MFLLLLDYCHDFVYLLYELKPIDFLNDYHHVFHLYGLFVNRFHTTPFQDEKRKTLIYEPF